MNIHIIQRKNLMGQKNDMATKEQGTRQRIQEKIPKEQPGKIQRMDCASIIKRRSSEGWIAYFVFVPVEIKNQIKIYKRKLMQKYWW